ncbi:DHA2 family efflux MFS transporter permease subunit [Nocardia barduliensis]|uniref:DHA2 family efflux MFS transporter permease subunit n=1 Tax=Nocardia barduliensis TaxID=2736643 RepID=UPI001C2D1E13|nr:DHA2 family efflux MFS transporter permease subunit [Nocardia barduliensis]
MNTRPLIALLVCAGFVVVLNEMIMGVALPRLMVELAVSATAGQWLTGGFMLTMAVVTPLSGYLLGRLTLRSVYFGGMGLFSAGTVLAAAAPGFEVLLGARIVQACGTAVMIPLLMTTVLQVAAPQRRGRVMGAVSVVLAVAPAIGPVLAGAILSGLGWRWIFVLVAPVALLVLGLGAIWVREVAEPRAIHLDAPSVLLSVLAFGGPVYALSSLGEPHSGRTGLAIGLPAAAGFIALGWFVARQRRLQRDDRALLDLRTFASRSFGLAFVMVLLSTAGLFGALVLLPIYLQQVLGLSTVTTGLVMLPGGLTMGLTAPVAGRLYDRLGPRPLIIPGMMICTIALAVMASMDAHTGVGRALTAHLLLCLGFALAFTPLLTSALADLPTSLYAHGSALINTIQQVGGATGTALFIAVMSTHSAIGVGVNASSETAAQGARAAFIAGAAIVLTATALALLVRRSGPPPQPASTRN